MSHSALFYGVFVGHFDCNYSAYSSFTSTRRYFRTQSVTYDLYAPSLRAKMPRFEAKSKHAEQLPLI